MAPCGHQVGAVALDGAGEVAAATSTGGSTGKRGGRVGDSPLAGAGGYADSEAGAVSTTGHGESISRVCLAHRVVRGLAAGPGPAAREGLQRLLIRLAPISLPLSECSYWSRRSLPFLALLARMERLQMGPG